MSMMHSGSGSGKKRIAYYYDDEIGNFYYGPGHPMKPHRMRLAHHLILAYGLYRQLEIYRPSLLSEDQLTMFHTDDYVHFLQHVNPDNLHQYSIELNRYNVDVDCPVFDGLYNFCRMYTGGSVGGAYKLNKGTADIAINWSGGLHHAKKSESSGFCYINDIVLAILELLKYHQRVLYIDIDIHHGDGVEEAFYTTDRVMTVSFHKYGDYFPGTGRVQDLGHDRGLNYALNFPLMDGIDDASYERIFKTVIGKVMETFRPGAVVLQCGADSLSGDRLGCFNLTLKGHGACVEYMKTFGVPLLLVGGGGYTVRNVARCWAYETGLALDTSMADELPYNTYYEYYGPDFNLHIQPSNMENLNTPNYLQKQESALLQALKQLPPAPSVQYSYQPPRDDGFEAREEREKARQEHERMRDVRVSAMDMDKAVVDRREFYADDKDQDASTIATGHGTKLAAQVGSGSAGASASSVAAATSTAAPSTAASATHSAPASAPSSSSSSSAPSSSLPSLSPTASRAEPAFRPNTQPTATGAPPISAPLANQNNAHANANTDTNNPTDMDTV